MNHILVQVKDFPKVDYAADAVVLRQGEKKNQILVLLSGSVEIVKNGMQICVVSEKGAVFGELSILLNNYHNATVRALEPSSFHLISDADRFLASNPDATLYIAKLLARRLSLLDSYFAEVKKEFFKLTTNINKVAAKKAAQPQEKLVQFWDKTEKGIVERRHHTP